MAFAAQMKVFLEFAMLVNAGSSPRLAASEFGVRHFANHIREGSLSLATEPVGLLFPNLHEDYTMTGNVCAVTILERTQFFLQP